ncbi:MAG: hypothetical protein DA329_10115 [Candidatus Nitrosocosmicus sp.]|mgnify:CR=1 FL=1|jgi:hypothetical protein|nr:hypothetical protein [Candidatus Nitrosocosmicus sp.]
MFKRLANRSYCFYNNTNNYCDSDSGKIKIGKVKGQKRILAEGFTINTFLHAMVRHSKCSLPSSKHLTIL